MNPVYKIIAARAAQIGLPPTAAWLLYRAVTGRFPPRIATAILGMGVSIGISAHLASTFVGAWDFGYPRLLTRLDTNEKIAALTFDDGPFPNSTPQLLDTLGELNTRATFFVLGERAERHPELVARMNDEGHMVALHGYHHQPLVLQSLSEVQDEIRRAQEAVPHCAARYFRPPHGFKSQNLQRACDAEGMILTAWSINPKDYHGVAPDAIAAHIWAHLHPGAIVLLHENRENTFAALPEIVETLREAGYEAVRIAHPDPPEAGGRRVKQGADLP